MRVGAEASGLLERSVPVVARGLEAELGEVGSGELAGGLTVPGVLVLGSVPWGLMVPGVDVPTPPGALCGGAA